MIINHAHNFLRNFEFKGATLGFCKKEFGYIYFINRNKNFVKLKNELIQKLKFTIYNFNRIQNIYNYLSYTISMSTFKIFL